MNPKLWQRNTQQRQVILEELRKLTSHPTAAKLCEIVRRRLPNISLGTVYRNLELLSQLGVIQKLEGGGEARFDGNAAQHAHIRCLACGCVADVLVNRPEKYPLPKCECGGFEVIGHRWEFFGLCNRCRQKRNIRKRYLERSHKNA